MYKTPAISSFASGAPPRSIPGPLPLVDRLYAAVLRATIWPLMNMATGRSIHRKLRFLDQSQWWPRARLEAYQLAKLQRLMRHVYERVPFYGREMRSRGIRPEDFTSLETLRHMPVVTKAMLQANPREFLAADYRFKDLITGATSGSTGQPTRFYRTREQDSWHWALKYRMWGMAGYRQGDPHVTVYNVQRQGLRRRMQDTFLRNRAFYAFESGDQERFLNNLCSALREPTVRYAAGSTSTLQLLADYRRSHPGPPLGLSALLTTGSVLPPQARSTLSAGLGAPVWDHYGLGGEGVHVAAECEYHDGYHVNVETLVLQPPDPASPTGVAAPLLVTALDNFGWPLIRYDSGDAAVFSARRCPCGRGLPLLERIEGRISEVITLPGGLRLNAHYFADLAYHDAVRQYQAEQVAPDRIELRIVWATGVPRPDLKAAIVERFDRFSRGTASLELQDIGVIAPNPNGKHRYIIPLATAVASEPGDHHAC